MSFRPEEVSAVIREELRKYTTTLEMESRRHMDAFIIEIRDQLRAISAEAGYAGKNRST